MVFGQILKNILDKNQSVFIPTIGLLGYDKATSKLGLDIYGSGTDSDLVHLISEIKQVNAAEAKGILIQEIESLKSTVFSQGKYNIEGLGEIIFNNGSFQFESKKTLFPTDFFSGGNFNPAAFKDNTPKEDIKVFENTFIKVEPPKKNEIEREEPKILEPQIEKKTIIESEREQPKDLFEAAKLDIEEKSKSKSFFSTVKDFFSSTTEKEENTVEEVKDGIEEIIENSKETPNELVPDTALDIQIDREVEIKEDDFTTKILNEISEEEEESDESEEEISEDEVILEEQESEEEIQLTESMPIVKKTIEIDEPRRNIGNARYDEGYYEYDLTVDDDKSNRWPLVAGLSVGFLAAGFLLAWIIATFQNKQLLGLKPLWNSQKAAPKKIEPTIASKLDTVTKLDTLKNRANTLMDTSKNSTISKADNMNPMSAAQKPVLQSNNLSNKAATAPATELSKTQQSTKNAQNTTKNTLTPKTPISADPVSKKSVAVATDKPKKSESQSSGNEAATIVSTKTTKSPKEKDTTMAKPTLAKVEKINIIGKPIATANYTKGNHYLSFGKFKIGSAAVKLRNDMKKRAGIETDIILLDGTYRVVVPYLSKEKAEEASRDYVSTTLFD